MDSFTPRTLPLVHITESTFFKIELILRISCKKALIILKAQKSIVTPARHLHDSSKATTEDKNNKGRLCDFGKQLSPQLNNFPMKSSPHIS